MDLYLIMNDVLSVVFSFMECVDLLPLRFSFKNFHSLIKKEVQKRKPIYRKLKECLLNSRGWSKRKSILQREIPLRPTLLIVWSDRAYQWLQKNFGTNIAERYKLMIQQDITVLNFMNNDLHDLKIGEVLNYMYGNSEDKMETKSTELLRSCRRHMWYLRVI